MAAGLIRPHYPNVAPKQYFDLYPFSKMKLPFVPYGDWKDMPEQAISNSNSKRFGIDKFPDNQKRMWSGYLATVTYMDEQVGRILNALKQLNLDKETAVIFTSDHGYLLGEHNFWQKGNLREEVTRVPLIIKSPESSPNRNSSIVELVDIFPTACELAGLPIPKSVQGKSLVPIIHKLETKVKNSALSFVPKGISFRTEKWSYMKYKDGSEELYDMRIDSKQFQNLVEKPEYLGQLTSIRQMYEKRTQSIW